MSIQEKALVVNLQIGQWAGYKMDKEATKAVTQAAAAAGDAARVNKHLVPKEAMKPIIAASNAIRLHFYDKTLPWKDNGDRLLTRVMFMDFINEHEKLSGEFKDAVKHFIDVDYPKAVEQAGFRMGGLFNIDDYPTPQSLQNKFYINLDIDPVTTGNDFRVDLDQQQLDNVRTKMEAAMEQRIGNAVHDIWDRLLKVVGHFAERMADEDAIFRQSTLTNIEELLEILPGLNVLGDPDIETMRLDIQQSLTGFDAKTLRQDPAARSEAANEAQRIMESMKGFMGAWGSNN